MYVFFVKNVRLRDSFSEYEHLTENIIQHHDQYLGQKFGNTVWNTDDGHTDEHDGHIHSS